MNQHTPGPWAVHPQALMAVHQPELVCWIPQNKEDAQLIAAAPDLLAVVQAIIGDGLHCEDVSPRLHRAALAAIAKATGVQP
jgi:hypothetical protein